MQVCEGFAHGNINALTGYWTILAPFGGPSLAVSTYAPSGGTGSGYSFRASSSSSGGFTPTFTNTEEWFHIAFYVEGTGTTGNTIVTFQRMGLDQFSVSLGNTTVQTVELRRGAWNGTVVATSAAGSYLPNQWNWLWIRLIAQDAGGTCSVYLNGSTTPIVTFTGDTQATATPGWDRLFIGKPDGFMPNVQFTNLVTYTAAEKTALWGGTFPELFIPAIRPTSDFLNTFGGGGGWAQVDEIPWSTADTAIANAVGQQLLCSGSGLGWTPAAIGGVAVTAYASRDGIVAGFSGRIEPGAATGPSAAIAGAGVYSERQWIWTLDPNTGVQWTYANVVAADFGVITT